MTETPPLPKENEEQEKTTDNCIHVRTLENLGYSLTDRTLKLFDENGKKTGEVIYEVKEKARPNHTVGFCFKIMASTKLGLVCPDTFDHYVKLNAHK